MPTRHESESGGGTWTVYHAAMGTIVINIDWPYFLGVIGSLLAVAYYAQGRFTGLETDVTWLKEMVSELTIRAENQLTKFFTNKSPASLTPAGHVALKASGLKSYIDANRNALLARIKRTRSDPYELQRRTFRLLAELPFEDIVAHRLNTYAFANGISIDFLRRLGALYLRDIAAPTS